MLRGLSFSLQGGSPSPELREIFYAASLVFCCILTRAARSHHMSFNMSRLARLCSKPYLHSKHIIFIGHLTASTQVRTCVAINMFNFQSGPRGPNCPGGGNHHLGQPDSGPSFLTASSISYPRNGHRADHVQRGVSLQASNCMYAETFCNCHCDLPTRVVERTTILNRSYVT